MRKEAEHIFNAFTFTGGDEKKYAKVIEIFDEHFVPKRNVIHERACFHRRIQKEGETVEAFVRNLYELAQHCEFETQRDEQIRDRIVIGIRRAPKSLESLLPLQPLLGLCEVKLLRRVEFQHFVFLLVDRYHHVKSMLHTLRFGTIKS